jgi:hypothetical protein
VSGVDRQVVIDQARGVVTSGAGSAGR